MSKGGLKKPKGSGKDDRRGSSRSRQPAKKTKENKISPLVLIVSAILVSVVSVGIAVGVRWYRTPSLIQPINLPPVINEDMRNDPSYKERLWGSYR